MKGSLLWRLMYLFCALAGCLAGYGIFSLAGSRNNQLNNITEDNTLVRKMEDGVFFDGETAEPMVTDAPREREEPTVTTAPREREEPTVTTAPVEKKEPVVTTAPIEKEEPQRDFVPIEIEVPETSVNSLREEQRDTNFVIPLAEQEDMPSLADHWVVSGAAALPPVPTPLVEAGEAEETEETITYPAKIFGQVPVINRSDAYVSYFEFAYDLVTMMEPEVQQRGINMNTLLAKFVIKALFCGVDIEKLDINAPIPRRLAALCLWLAAQVLEEAGSSTSANSAGKYVTDISGCSLSEKKAVAYLYEQGILEGYQVAGQRFYPDAGLQTKIGSTWLSRVKQCWK